MTKTDDNLLLCLFFTAEAVESFLGTNFFVRPTRFCQDFSMVLLEGPWGRAKLGIFSYFLKEITHI